MVSNMVGEDEVDDEEPEDAYDRLNLNLELPP